MPRPRRILYGWRGPEGRGYCLSKIPPDVPLLPIDCHVSIADAEDVALQRRSVVVWCGPAAIEKRLLMDAEA